MRWFPFIILLLTVLTGKAYCPPIVWPADSAWNPMTQSNGQYFWDTLGDDSPSQIDLVGDTVTYPGAYWLYDCCGTYGNSADDLFLFRMRVDAVPVSSANSVWTFVFDTNQDGLVEWALQLDGKNNNVVELVPTVVGGQNVGDITLSPTSSWSGAISDYSRFTPATGSNFGGTPDGFVDIGIPWSSFSAITGINQNTPLSYAPLTSTTDQAINSDIPQGLAGNAPVSSVLSDSRPAVPEPTTLVLLATVFGGSLLRRNRRPARV